MSHDFSGHCFFKRQPVNAAETDSAIRAVWTSCCQALRYGGDDPAILKRFAEIGESSQCDFPPIPTPPKVIRNCARFEYETRDRDASIKENLKAIVAIVSESLVRHPSQKCSRFKYSKTEASFRFHWGIPSRDLSIRFHLAQESESCWILRVSENDTAQVGLSMTLDTILRKISLFRAIEWFTEEEVANRSRIGKPHPY